jgi:hypothetical protein
VRFHLALGGAVGPFLLLEGAIGWLAGSSGCWEYLPGTAAWRRGTLSSADSSCNSINTWERVRDKWSRAILNFTPGPQGWTSLQGVNLAPRGEICHLGGMFTPSFTPRGDHSQLFRRTVGQTENFTPRG